MGNNPVFIKIEEYREILDIVDVFKKKVKNTKDILNQIEGTRAEEDMELKAWKTNIDEIESRMNVVDKTLFEPDL